MTFFLNRPFDCAQDEEGERIRELEIGELVMKIAAVACDSFAMTLVGQAATLPFQMINGAGCFGSLTWPTEKSLTGGVINGILMLCTLLESAVFGFLTG